MNDPYSSFSLLKQKNKKRGNTTARGVHLRAVSHVGSFPQSVAAPLPIKKDAALGQRLVFFLPLIGGESARVFVYAQLNSLHCNLSGKVIKGINSIILSFKGRAHQKHLGSEWQSKGVTQKISHNDACMLFAVTFPSVNDLQLTEFLITLAEMGVKNK